MVTYHKIVFSDSRDLNCIENESINLVITSPPYPMIEMWDKLFMKLNSDIEMALERYEGATAFELMHTELDKVWTELYRVVKPGGFVCINIGDATRKVGKNFRLYSNHARITDKLTELSFQMLPLILWRKTTNAPNKFMGSGMLPAGAYVTLEHEYILIFRKGEKRIFSDNIQKESRYESAILWEERNKWYSDIWELGGTKQYLNNSELRERSAAYPFELSYRLINMYSVKGDTVLDPFLGTCTTIFSAIASGRNSIGIEIDSSFNSFLDSELNKITNIANQRIMKRINDHLDFVSLYTKTKGELKYINSFHNFSVMTKQEQRLKMELVDSISRDTNGSIRVSYNLFAETPETNISNLLKSTISIKCKNDKKEYSDEACI